MIVSYKHNFIFLHVPKVAGSSIASYFAKHLGPRDFMIDTWGDALRYGAAFNRQFYRDIFCTKTGLVAFAREMKGLSDWSETKSKNDFLYRVHQKRWRPRLRGEYAHACAFDAQRCFPDEFERYFKFAFVRNPYAHAVSLWRWRCIGENKDKTPSVSFSEFLRCLEDHSIPDPEYVRRKNKWEPTGWNVFSIDGSVSVDFIGRFENLKEDLNSVCDKVGIKFQPDDFPHAKNVSQASNDYKNYYESGDREIVERLYSNYIETFGYEF